MVTANFEEIKASSSIHKSSVKGFKINNLLHTLHNTGAIGKVLIILDEVDSTNEHAKRLLTKNTPAEGTAILAHHQTRGKGRLGKFWESEKGGNLLISIILFPHFLEASKVFFLNQIVCLALVDLFKNYLNISVKVKWPNDIYLHDKKLAGVLIENSFIGNKIQNSIIGIGINVNQTAFDPGLPNPVSLKNILNKEIDVLSLAKELFFAKGVRYQQLKTLDFFSLQKEYNEILYRKDEKHFFKTRENIFEGIINGVNDQGQLLISSENKIQKFNMDEISFL